MIAGWEISGSKFAWAEEQPSSEPKTDGPIMDRSRGSSSGNKVSQPICNDRQHDVSSSNKLQI